MRKAMLPIILVVVLMAHAGIVHSLIPNEFTTQAVTLFQVTQDLCPEGNAFPVVETTISDVHARIRKYDQTTGLNAIRAIVPKVKQQAHKMDATLESLIATSTPLPKLFCVPMIIKDNYDFTGMATTDGAVGWLDAEPYQDATQVKQLKNAGAIVIAKSNLAEFAFSNQKSIGSVYGIVRNPYDLNRVTAGSSGGTAASISSNLGLIGLGTDTGNSIRGPSSHQSLVGIRSSIGMTSRAGIAPLRLNRDIGGPIGRTVRDVAKVFTVLAGEVDPRDPITSVVSGKPRLDYEAYLDASGLQGARIAVLTEVVFQPGADPAYINLFLAAVAQLEASGATIVNNFTIPGWTYLFNGTEKIRNFPGNTITNATAGRSGGGSVLINGAYESAGLCNPFKEDLNAWVSGTKAKLQTVEALIASGLYHPQSNASLYSSTFGSGTGLITYTKANFSSDPRWAGATCNGCLEYPYDACRMTLRQNLIAAMDAANVSAVIYPTWTNFPRLIGDDTSPSNDNSQNLSPISGAPAMTVPIGFGVLPSNGGSTVPTRLPAGMQLLGRPFEEHVLFKLAYAYEQATKKREAPRAFPECGTSIII